MSRWNELFQSHVSRSFGERHIGPSDTLECRPPSRGYEVIFKNCTKIELHISDKRQKRITRLVDKKLLYLTRTRPARDLPLQFKLKMRNKEPVYPI